MEEVNRLLEDRSRRDYLRTIGVAGMTAVAGCGRTGDSGDGGLGSKTPSEYPDDTTSASQNPETPTTERATTEDERQEAGFKIHNIDALENVEPVHIVTPENSQDTVPVQTRVQHRGNSSTAKIYFWNENSEKKQPLLETQLPENPYEFSLELPRQLVGPGTNTFKLVVEDGEGHSYERKKSFSGGDFGYKFDVHDHHGTLPPKTGVYTDEIEHTFRTWDNIHTEITEQEWEDMYWNDIKYGRKLGNMNGFPFQDVKEKVDQKINQEDTPEEKIYKTVETIHHNMPDVGSGKAADLFYTVERDIAKNVLGWGTDQHHVIRMPTTGSHEVIPRGFKDKNGDWQIRWHRPVWALETYGKPENTDMRSPYPEDKADVDGFNYSKLHKKAAATPNEPENTQTQAIHELPAISLMKWTETGADLPAKETGGSGGNIASNPDQLKYLQANTVNENFQPDKYRLPSRAIQETLIEEKTDIPEDEDFLGVELRAENLYRLNEQQYWDIIKTFDYDPFEVAKPQDPVNDMSELITS